MLLFAALFAAGAELGLVDGLAPDRQRRCSQYCFLFALFVYPVVVVLGAPQQASDGILFAGLLLAVAR